MTGSIRETFMGTVGEAMSEGFMNMTGLGEFFGGSMAKIKHMFGTPFEKGGAIIGNDIITACDTGGTSIATKLSATLAGGGAVTAMGTGTTGGMGGGMGAMLPFLGQQITPPTGTTKGGNYLGGTQGAAGALGSMTWGNLLGGITTGAMVGYSAYQSMATKGVNKGYAGTAGGLQGVGAGLMMIGMMGGPATYWLAGVGMAMEGAGSLMQMFAKGGESTQISEQTRVETKQVASKLDISNKQLELVNRNLVSLKESMEYIMTSSYYFRERNLTDRFAIDSQRGNM